MEAFPWPARQIELYRYTGLVVAFGQSFINVCINTREHRGLLGWLGLPLGLGSLLYFAAVRKLLVMQSALHRMLILLKQLVPFTTTYIFSWLGCAHSQPVGPTHTLLLTSQSCQPEHALLWRALVNFVAIVQLISCHGSQHCTACFSYFGVSLPSYQDNQILQPYTKLLFVVAKQYMYLFPASYISLSLIFF